MSSATTMSSASFSGETQPPANAGKNTSCIRSATIAITRAVRMRVACGGTGGGEGGSFPVAAESCPGRPGRPSAGFATANASRSNRLSR